MPAVLFSSTFYKPDLWLEEFRRAAPDIEVRVWPEVGDPAEIDVALGWGHPKEPPIEFPNLKLISATGAGIDHIMGDPTRPKHVPVARLVEEMLTTQMSEYVLACVLRYHRQFVEFEAAQREAAWPKLTPPDTAARRIGMLGLGVLGLDAARKLRALGFPVAGWSRGPKQLDGIECFHGRGQLAAFLGGSHILVCLLPLTPETRGIINAETLALLPRGAYVINPARGGHVVDADLIAALDCGHIAHATLDVFHQEPLPRDHPFWRHPKVTVTPHAASATIPRTAVPQIVANIRRVRAGLAPLNQVDPDRGY